MITPSDRYTVATHFPVAQSRTLTIQWRYAVSEGIRRVSGESQSVPGRRLTKVNPSFGNATAFGSGRWSGLKFPWLHRLGRCRNRRCDPQFLIGHASEQHGNDGHWRRPSHPGVSAHAKRDHRTRVLILPAIPVPISYAHARSSWRSCQTLSFQPVMSGHPDPRSVSPDIATLLPRPLVDPTEVGVRGHPHIFRTTQLPAAR